jgi:hypothetical protein
MNEAELDEGDKKVLSDIKQYGLHIVHILEDEQGPGFSFSIGLYKNYNHPEIILIGLKQELSHSIINNIAQEVKDGKKYQSLNFYSDLIEGFDCYFIEVDKLHYKNYMGYANWYYNGNKFPALQCIYPTTKGVYPWQNEWPESIKNLQPILGSVNKPNQL